VLLIALAMLAPCTYVTFLWNRLRYLWPFATGWLIGIACLARLVGDALGLIRPRFRVATLLVCGLVAGMLAMRLEWVLEDVAQSASGIARQQASLGKWAKETLPASARIGVNDTGAIAYFSDRRTFDVVGLTSAGEARYWVAGAGSRLEHYEQLAKSAPQALPSHFIVYPEWMACDAVLGTPLHEATVIDATILGGQTMRAYEADYGLLGSGEGPWSALPAGAAIVDTLDVADLESEAEHRYALLGARDGEQIAKAGASPAAMAVVDGGRTKRQAERFVAKLRPGQAARGIVRAEWAGGAPGRVRVLADGVEIGSFELSAGEWREQTFEVPAAAAKVETWIELRPDAPMLSVYHYWFVQPVTTPR
jgi:hypothetical protein